MGWVQKNRNKGGLVFTDVRDRSGIIQVVCEEGTTDAAIIEKAASLRAEYVVAVVGKVEKRSGAVNDKIATGEIEVIPSELRVLSESQTPPFPIEENSKTKEDIRLKYRYLDLRRPDLQRNLRMKSQVMTLTRQFFSDEDSLRWRHQCLERQLRKVQEITLYQAACTRDLSTDFHSLRSFTNSF